MGVVPKSRQDRTNKYSADQVNIMVMVTMTMMLMDDGDGGEGWLHKIGL